MLGTFFFIFMSRNRIAAQLGIYGAHGDLRLGDAAKAKDCYDRAVTWIHEHQNQVTPEWAEELKGFQAEAEVVLAKSGPGAKRHKKLRKCS
jgi:hypothetical protein